MSSFKLMKKIKFSISLRDTLEYHILWALTSPKRQNEALIPPAGDICVKACLHNVLRNRVVE